MHSCSLNLIRAGKQKNELFILPHLNLLKIIKNKKINYNF